VRSTRTPEGGLHKGWKRRNLDFLIGVKSSISRNRADFPTSFLPLPSRVGRVEPWEAPYTPLHCSRGTFIIVRCAPAPTAPNGNALSGLLELYLSPVSNFLYLTLELLNVKVWTMFKLNTKNKNNNRNWEQH